MNLIFISVLLVIIAAGLVTNKPSSTPVQTETETSVPEDTSVPEETQTPSPTITPTTTPTLKPTQAPSSSPAVVENSWVYPGSKIVENGDKLILLSSATTDEITDWYKSKITSLGFNVRSFVKTSANDVVKNVLSAAKDNREVGVVITRNPDDAETRIEVTDSL